MVTQTCTDSLYVLRIHVTKVTWTWGNNERKPNSIVSTSLISCNLLHAGMQVWLHRILERSRVNGILVTEKWTFAQIKMPYIERFIYGLFSRFLQKLLAEESVSQSLKKWTLLAERWLHCRSSKTFTISAQKRQNRLTSPSNPYQQIAE